MFLGMQEGFAAPEDEDIDEQAHLDQDEYWVPPSLPVPPSRPPFPSPHSPAPSPPPLPIHFGITSPLHAVDISSITSVSMDAPYVLSICLSTPTTVHALRLKGPVLQYLLHLPDNSISSDIS